MTRFAPAQVHPSSWPDPALYPFTHRYLPVEGGRLHYVDEGEGAPILFVHGTPTWSFLFRDQIRALRGQYRCVAPDHLGFGLSDKPPKADYSPAAHSRRLEALVEHLDLRDITLVVHDFGGPIGLSWALRHPERVRRIVLMNTWLWATAGEPAVRQVDRLVRSALGRFLYLRLNASPRWLLPRAFADKRLLTKDLHRHYLAPFPNKNARYSLLRIAGALLGASDWYREQWEKLDRLTGKPWLLLWGTRDTFIREDYLHRWEERLPDHRTVTVDCGHFVAEENSAVVTAEIRAFVDG